MDDGWTKTSFRNNTKFSQTPLLRFFQLDTMLKLALCLLFPQLNILIVSPFFLPLHPPSFELSLQKKPFLKIDCHF